MGEPNHVYFCYDCGRLATPGTPPECPEHGPLWKLTRNVPCADIALFHQGQILLGQRRGAPFQGFWSIPGGHQDLGEHPQDTALRELWEEFGIEPDDVMVPQLLTVSMEGIDVDDHRQIVVYEGVARSKHIRVNLDEHFTGGWFWMTELPEPVTPHTRQVIEFLRGKRVAELH